MKTLLQLKQTDFWVQAFVLGISIVSVRDPITTYLAIGIVQVISCLPNLFLLKRDYQNNGRFLYNIILLIIFVTGLLVYTPLIWGKGSDDLIFIYLVVLLFVGFIMCFWYLIMSYKEMQYIDKLVKRHELIK